MEKIPMFDQKFLTKNSNFWPNPIFSTFLKRHFCVQESLLFYLEYQQTIFVGLFCPKTKYGKNSNFWKNLWTNPFANIRILPLFSKKIILKNAFFSIYNISEHYFSAYFAQKQTMEKILIFDQNHGLTPLQKFEFCHFFENKFLR